MTVYGHEFHFDGMAVGLFVGADGPRTPGLHPYEPYLGPGHYEMQTLRRAGGSPRCYYEAGHERVWFTVKDCRLVEERPEHAFLELCDFESMPLGTV